ATGLAMALQLQEKTRISGQQGAGCPACRAEQPCWELQLAHGDLRLARRAALVGEGVAGDDDRLGVPCRPALAQEPGLRLGHRDADGPLGAGGQLKARAGEGEPAVLAPEPDLAARRQLAVDAAGRGGVPAAQLRRELAVALQLQLALDL